MHRKFILISIFCLGGLAGVVVAAFLAMVQPGGSGVLASMRLADGSEYMVTQTCNWSAEPYTVAFYLRSGAEEPWGWCYIDHEAGRWREVKMSHEASTDTLMVTERGVLRATLERRTGRFWINAGITRDVIAPQSQSPPPYPMP
jgi:hypothetical protein